MMNCCGQGLLSPRYSCSNSVSGRINTVDQPRVCDVVEKSPFRESVDNVDEPLQRTGVEGSVCESMPANPLTARI
ncbi:unnamed protein product [Haemonchus placei]|uniref:Uncharacterized protein n=1 Tax=Haemonchus placei TaxID=6290 RepID=A0A3P7Y270_HAEPC|nr:unnamed protein product [Haemonchus placei]